MSSRIVWESVESLCPRSVETAKGLVHVRRGHFMGGRSEGVEIVEIDTGTVAVAILPTRGMGIWNLRAGGLSFGWQSPVPGPVHPSYVPIFDPSGVGWLEGFDELLVRCGLESNGAPEKDAAGGLLFPLHGRIANLPASRLSIEIEAETGRVTLVGEVVEARFLVKRLRLIARITVTAGESGVEVVDEIVNDKSTEATAQLLYHINLGAPLVSEGAKLLARPVWFEAKDALSRSELDRWSSVGGPQAQFQERVYFSRLEAHDEHTSAACLRAADGEAGFGLTYDPSTLPYFTFWRNTGALNDGYVVGLEPATNLPNMHSVETAAGRFVRLGAHESVVFRLGLHPLVGRAEVEDFRTRMKLGSNDPLQA